MFLAGEGSYQQIFQEAGGARSPVEHFWSLAIEEQFYWVWPPTMLFVLGRAHSARSRTIALAALTAVFVVAAPVIAAVWGPDAAYWATPARIAEILLGALLAVVLAHRSVPAATAWLAPAALARPRRVRRAVPGVERPGVRGLAAAGRRRLGSAGARPAGAGPDSQRPLALAVGVAGPHLVRRLPLPLADLRDRSTSNARASTGRPLVVAPDRR